MDAFERALLVSCEDLEFQLLGVKWLPWSDLYLNPRRLRGSDFLMRWSQGVWSEQRITEALAATGRFFALPFGPSGTAPDDVREYELYFERLAKAGLGKIKRPDLLVYNHVQEVEINSLVKEIGGVAELPFVPEDDRILTRIIDGAILAVECENSLWQARRMPDFSTQLTPQRRLNGRLGLKKSAVLPTVIIKEEDRPTLQRWQSAWNKKIHIWHAFYDLALGISLDEANRLIAEGLIEPTIQTFQAPGGAVTKKTIYKFYSHYAYQLGESQQEPSLVADKIVDKNGHILPFVRFQGGELKINADVFSMLEGPEGKE